MNLTFFGAARAVTGSCHCLDVGNKRILIDCGLQQGRDEIDNTGFLFDAQEVDCVSSPTRTSTTRAACRFCASRAFPGASSRRA